MLAALVALTVAPVLLPAEKVSLAREYKADESHVYALDVNAEAGGGELSVKTEVVFKVKKTQTNGAEISMSNRKFEEQGAGGATAPEEMVSRFGPNGVPDVMSTEGFAWIYILASFANLVPAKEVEVGQSFDLNWTSNDGSSSLKGKGKVLEIAEVDGSRNAKIEYTLEVTPGHESTGSVKMMNILRLKDMVGLSSEGSVEVESGPLMKFKVKRLEK